MRRVFVLLIVFLISLQFVDEAFADTRIPVEQKSELPMTFSGQSCLADKLMKQTVVCEAKVGSNAHADFSDSVLMHAGLPFSVPTVAWLREVTFFVFPIRVFPVLEPPRG